MARGGKNQPRNKCPNGHGCDRGGNKCQRRWEKSQKQQSGKQCRKCDAGKPKPDKQQEQKTA